MINEVIICIEDVNVLIYMMLFYDVFFVIVMFVGLHVKLKGYDCASLNENEFSKILVISLFFQHRKINIHVHSL